MTDTELDEAMEAFDKFVLATPDSASHIVRAASSLTGAQLYVVRRLIEELTVRPCDGEFEEGPNDLS